MSRKERIVYISKERKERIVYISIVVLIAVEFLARRIMCQKLIPDGIIDIAELIGMGSLFITGIVGLFSRSEMGVYYDDLLLQHDSDYPKRVKFHFIAVLTCICIANANITFVALLLLVLIIWNLGKLMKAYITFTLAPSQKQKIAKAYWKRTFGGNEAANGHNHVETCSAIVANFMCFLKQRDVLDGNATNDFYEIIVHGFACLKKVGNGDDPLIIESCASIWKHLLAGAKFPVAQLVYEATSVYLEKMKQGEDSSTVTDAKNEEGENLVGFIWLGYILALMEQAHEEKVESVYEYIDYKTRWMESAVSDLEQIWSCAIGLVCWELLINGGNGRFGNIPLMYSCCSNTSTNSWKLTINSNNELDMNNDMNKLYFAYFNCASALFCTNLKSKKEDICRDMVTYWNQLKIEIEGVRGEQCEANPGRDTCNV